MSGAGVGEGAEAIRCEGVWFAYGEQPVLEDVTFRVGAGESVCVVGPNGGGKTTLLRLLLGLARPTSGAVWTLGRSPERARSSVGYVPQVFQFDPLFPVSALEVVQMGGLDARPRPGGYDRASREAALELLDRMGMGDVSRSPFASLSGGQRQRVLIARALACAPSLLLMDEPMAHVDLAAEDRFREMLGELGGRITLVTVSHDLAFVSRLVRKVICVNRRVRVHGVEDLTPELLERLYGGRIAAVDHRHGGGEG